MPCRYADGYRQDVRCDSSNCNVATISFAHVHLNGATAMDAILVFLGSTVAGCITGLLIVAGVRYRRVAARRRPARVAATSDVAPGFAQYAAPEGGTFPGNFDGPRPR
jgi:hypothetical protein